MGFKFNTGIEHNVVALNKAKLVPLAHRQKNKMEGGVLGTIEEDNNDNQ